MKQEDWKGFLVYVEIRNQEVSEISLELLSKARELSKVNGEPVYGVLVGEKGDFCEEKLKDLSLKKCFFYQLKDCFQADIYEEPIIDCIQKLRPAVFLIGGTIQGRALASRIAVAFKTGVTADCTSLELTSDHQLLQTRPAFGGNIMASILTTHSRPQIATVRPGIFSICEKKEKKSVIIEKLEWNSEKKHVITLQKMKIKKEVGIEKQKLLVVAGRGVKKKEDLEMLRELAVLSGGALASSRALVEKGWMRPEEQIGLSGCTVKPQCMITFGVSGTVQFMAGMKHTPNIIAVNTDPEARIFDIAHYPICGDLYEIVPELLHILKREGEK